MDENDRRIAELERENRQLRETQDRLRALINASPAAIFVKDLVGRYILVNRRFVELVPPAEDRILGKTDHELFPREQADAFRAFDRKVLDAGAVMEAEEVLVLDDGPHTYISSKCPLTDAAGQVYGICGVSTDITEQKRVEERLLRERRLFMGGPVVVFRWRAEEGWPVDYVSPNVAGLFGHEAADFTSGRVPYATLIHPDDRARFAGEVAAFSASDAPYFEQGYRIVRPDGEVRWLHDFTVVARDGSGRITHFEGYVLDATERKRAEAEREALLERERAARADAEAASRMKDEFLATLSHELRTPLQSILGWAQILGTGRLAPEEARHGVETIERNARLQAKLIEDLLDMSRIVAGRLVLDVKSVEPVGMIGAALRAILPAAEAKGVRLESSMDPAVGAIRGDPDRLHQVVWNLLSNAVKFTPAGGAVRVALRRVGAEAQIQVRDTGIGIAPAFLPHVFERFRQADASSTRAHSGLGLGLAIVRHLVEAHGGTVDVQSAGPGQGACFTVSLPLAGAVAPAPEPPSIEPRDAPGAAEEGLDLEGVRVLVVEDDPDTRELIGRVLGARHAEVQAVGSAAEALEQLDDRRPSVVVSDVAMPGEDGLSLIQKIRQRPRERGGDVPALALTAFARGEDRARLLRAGYQVHLPKPVEPAELVASVARLAGVARPHV